MVKKIIYKGEKFYMSGKRRYYESGVHGGDRALHRRIWTEINGPIPSGFVIHHKNSDPSDNRIENLQIMESRAHTRFHMNKPENKAKSRKSIKVAILAAPKWHGSDEGRKWHSGHGRYTWSLRKKSKAKCSICGKDYETFWPTRSRFCSHRCEQKEGYLRAKTAHGQCALCGKEFIYNKFKTQECCSRDCSNKMHHKGIAK